MRLPAERVFHVCYLRSWSGVPWMKDLLASVRGGAAG